MHENIQPPHSKQAFLNVPTVPRPKQERHCIWWLHHFLFKRNIYPLLQLYHYRKHILYSQNHHIRNTFLGISQFFLFYRRHIIFHIKTFFCFCFPHASLSPATSSVFAPNLHLDHFTVKPKSTYPSSQIFELPNANLKPTRQFVPKGFFEVTKLSDASSKQQPPRTLHLLSFISIQALSHNSSTLPVISYNPSSFGRFCPCLLYTSPSPRD